jgi:phosphoribosylamine-glycine ligase
MIDFIQARPDQEFILQKFVPDAICEIGIECYFSKGKLINISHTIETKKFMPGNLGPNTGCMSSISWFCKEDELFNLTWKKILHIFEAEKYTGACDISGIITKDGKFNVLECTSRFGYSQDIDLYGLLDMKISDMWIGLANGTLESFECDRRKFAGTARGSIPPYPVEVKKGFEKQVKDLIADTINTPVIFKQHDDCNIFWIDVKKNKKGELITAGIDAIICEVRSVDTDIMKLQDKVLSQLKDIKLGDFQYRNDCFKDAFEQIPQIIKMELVEGLNATDTTNIA